MKLAVLALTSVALVACTSGPTIGAITVSPRGTIVAGAEAVVSIEVRDLGVDDRVLWECSAGQFVQPTNGVMTKWRAPDGPGDVHISCVIVSGRRQHTQQITIRVVPREAVPAPVAPPQPQPEPQPKPAEPEPRPVRAAPYDIMAAGDFVPSGWMGDAEAGPPVVQAVMKHGEGAKSAPHCMRWSYRPDEGDGWAAVAWQYPEKNWGEKEGKNLRGRGYAKVTFWARAVPDSHGRLPRIQFKAGGHTAPSARHAASFAVSTDWITLTEDWKQYEIPLEKRDLSNVVSAFAWVANRARNPHGATFFLDDIRYE